MASHSLTNTQRFTLLVLAILAATYVARHKLPPFEAGLHDSVVEAHAYDASHGGPMIGPCPVFPADNVWNTSITNLPKDSHSTDYIDSIGPAKKLHPDFGSDPNNGIPYTLLPPGTRPVHVEFEYRDDSDLGNYPVPVDAPVEHGGNPDSDRHVIVVDQQRCVLYELFAAERASGDSWKAGSGVKIDLTSNSLREEGKTSADAAGLPIFPGLVRYDEVQSGAIRHALRFTVPHTQAAFVWPARHQASQQHSTQFPPLGQRFRLRADFDASGYSKTNQVIIAALKTYGMILADNGGPMFISGVPDKRWDDDDLHHLSQITADNFEAVDESGLQMLANSGRVDPKAAAH